MVYYTKLIALQLNISRMQNKEDITQETKLYATIF